MTKEVAAKTPRGLAHSTTVGWAVRLLTVLSSVSLATLLVATFAGVVMRYVFGTPILGSNEIIQLVSVALVMLAMPVAAQHGDHIRVDVMDGVIGAWGRFVGDLLARAIAAFLLYQLALRAWVKLKDAAEFGDATNMLAIPLWPFYGLIVLGSVLYAVVLVLQFVDVLRTGANRDE